MPAAASQVIQGIRRGVGRCRWTRSTKRAPREAIHASREAGSCA